MIVFDETKSASEYWNLTGSPTDLQLFGDDNGPIVHIHPPGAAVKHWSFRVLLPNGITLWAKAEMLWEMPWSDIRGRINKTELAKYLGITPSAVSKWGMHVPDKHRKKFEQFVEGMQ